MKKILEILASAAIALILLVCGGAIVNSCTERGLASMLGTCDCVVQDDLTPLETTFSTPQDVIIYRDQLRKKLQTDSILFAFPDKTLTDVAYKVIKLAGECSVDDIIQEYNANRAVYDNLPPPNDQAKNDESKDPPSLTTDERKIARTEYQVKDTTIDGKQATITTKTETYE